MLVRPPPPFGATSGNLPRCLTRPVPLMTTVKTTAATVLGSPVNVVAAYHGRCPSQLRWQSQLLCPQAQAPKTTSAVTTAKVRVLGGKWKSSSMMMQLVGSIRLASTSIQSSEAVQKGKGEVVQASNGESKASNGGEQQAQLPPTATNGVPQLKVPKLEYPERLLIYNAGKGKIIFIILLKFTTVLIFGFGLLVAPAYIANGSPLAGIAIFTCALTPFLFLAHSSRPLVAQIHLTKIPPYARLSSDVLLRFARSLPPQSPSRLEFVTMSLIGRPRVASVSVADLKPVPSSQRGLFKKVNFVRVDHQPTAAASAGPAGAGSAAIKNEKLSSNQLRIQQLQAQKQALKDKKQQGWKQRILEWTRFKSVNEFYVTDVPQKTAGKRGVKEARVWEEIRGLIEKRAVREAEKMKVR
ncbi:hypothetical protein QBC32DRAFT_251926 [Pseudoneurospora amorphoporcata]|uniref:Uncharacterized protein n=1 Tax=Pseudoneurospora amorphoporcata TaxID=241081 RepID=A0AAN6SJK2_9PEZI|nr:hypothetical protein QBC32DRAFT_251926 [Pseudoneurospora amorphoporcata]